MKEKEAELEKVRAEAGQATMSASLLPDLRRRLASTEAALAKASSEGKAWEERALALEAAAARLPGLEASVREKEGLVESLRAELEEALRLELEEAGGKVPLSLQVTGLVLSGFNTPTPFKDLLVVIGRVLS